MSARPVGKCTNPDCTFNEGGPCVDGFVENEIADKCPNFSEGEVTENSVTSTVAQHLDNDEQSIPAEMQPADEGIALPSGQALYPEDLYDITRDNDARIVLFAGPIESGKTTLIVSIYEKFRHGPFASHFFGGSETLIGFEKRCHSSRAASGREEAHTERTPASSRDILHLTLASEGDLSQKIDLLLVDVSGEVYEAAQNYDEEVNNIPLVRQAHFFTYVFDGDKLANIRHRQSIKNKGMNIIRALHENGALNTDSSVQIVFSKKDKYEANTQEIENFIQEIQSALVQNYGEKFKSLTFHTIAARPSQGATVETAYGIDALITKWTEIPSPTEFKIDYASHIKDGLAPFDSYCRVLEGTGE